MTNQLRWKIALNNRDWKLFYGGRCVADVYVNNKELHAVWCTWDQNGVGGENDAEYGTTTVCAVRKAQLQATLAVINQGFV